MLLIIAIAGMLPAYLRKRPIQRTWMLTVLPFGLLFFIITVDGKFLDDALVITEKVILMCIIFGSCWYATNSFTKFLEGISFKKGDMEVSITGKRSESSSSPPPPPEEGK